MPLFKNSTYSLREGHFQGYSGRCCWCVDRLILACWLPGYTADVYKGCLVPMLNRATSALPLLITLPLTVVVPYANWWSVTAHRSRTKRAASTPLPIANTFRRWRTTVLHNSGYMDQLLMICLPMSQLIITCALTVSA